LAAIRKQLTRSLAIPHQIRYTSENMFELRLGDDLDDFCIKCKRLTNHTIVSLIGDQPAKVRCRACYNDHDFRHEQAPPTKKELKTAQLLKEALEAGGELPPPEAVVEKPLKKKTAD
jgi:hypothetical protein